jgi:hypothetical protein
MKDRTSISNYHEYIQEAILSLRVGLQLKSIEGEIISRYSFLMISNAIEAGANALLKSLEHDKEYYEELEKLNTLLKIKVFCTSLGKKLDTGNVKFGRVKDIIICRNDFVHPKPKIVEYEFNSNSEIEYDISRTKNRYYPLYFSEIKPSHSLTALQDALEFISWICFDICQFTIQEGALKLGLNSYGSTSDIYFIEADYNLKFDKRSFGPRN